MNIKYERGLSAGFTLIELLMVIAIIGILAAVVMASLNNARSKAADVSIKANLAGLRTLASNIYDNNLNYNTICGADGATQDAKVAAAVTAITNASGGTAPTCGMPASGTANDWAVASRLKSAGFWCVDSTGASRGATSGGTAYDGVITGTTPALTDANDMSCN